MVVPRALLTILYSVLGLGEIHVFPAGADTLVVGVIGVQGQAAIVLFAQERSWLMADTEQMGVVGVVEGVLRGEREQLRVQLSREQRTNRPG